MLNKARTWIDDALRVVGAWTLVSAASGAAVLTLVQRYWPQYAPFVTASVVGFLGVLFFVAAIRVLRWHQEESGDWDDKTLQRTVRDWVDPLGQVTKIPDPSALFNYQVETKIPSTVLNVVRLKETPRYIHIVSSLALGGSHIGKYESLSLDDQRAFLAQLRIEISRLGVGWAGFGPPLDKMKVVERIPIVAEFSEYRFDAAIQSVSNATVLVRQVVQWKLGTGVEPDAQSQTTPQIENGSADPIPPSSDTAP